MTKEELLAIIEQNKDILTPENYQGIVNNVDIFSEAEWELIALYLDMAHKMKESNRRFAMSLTALYEKTAGNLGQIRGDMIQHSKEAFADAESAQQSADKGEIDNLFSNL